MRVIFIGKFGLCCSSLDLSIYDLACLFPVCSCCCVSLHKLPFLFSVAQIIRTVAIRAAGANQKLDDNPAPIQIPIIAVAVHMFILSPLLFFITCVYMSYGYACLFLYGTLIAKWIWYFKFIVASSQSALPYPTRIPRSTLTPSITVASITAIIRCSSTWFFVSAIPALSFLCDNYRR